MRYAKVEIVYEDGIVDTHEINDPHIIDNVVGIALHNSPDPIKEIRIKFMEELFI